MGAKEFEYYIFIDFSENFIGYSIIEYNKFLQIIPKITRFRHYKDADNKKIYIKNIRNTIQREDLLSYFFKIKIKSMSNNIELYSDVLDFLKKHENCIIFISVDNRQYSAFQRLVNIVDGEKVIVKQESELKVGSPEYQVSLVLDNLLNIERLKEN